MAITVGNNSNSGVIEGGGDSADFSWAHTVAATSNLIVIVVLTGQDSNRLADSVTYDGDALTHLVNDRKMSHCQASMWYRLNPSTGSNSCRVVDSSESANIIGVAMDFFVPGLSVKLSSSETGTTDPNLTVPCPNGEAIVIGGVTHADNNARTAASSQTETLDTAFSNGVAGRFVCGYKTAYNKSSQPMSWTGNNDDYVEIGGAFGVYLGAFFASLL